MKPTIGASSAAAALGLSPWESPLELWQRLTGRVSGRVETPAMTRGVLLEPGLREWYAGQVDTPVYRGPTLAEPGWHVSEHVHARPDSWRPINGGAALNEIKSARTGDEWADGIPIQYLVQVLTQLASEHPDGLRVLRCEVVAYVLESEGPVMHVVERDDRRQDAVREKLERFYRDFVIADRPPPPRTEEERMALLSTLTPNPGVWVEATDEDRALVSELADVRRTLKDAKAREDRIKQALGLRIGEATGIRDLIAWNAVKGRSTLDANALREEHPDIAARFTRTGAPTRRFRILGANGDE